MAAYHCCVPFCTSDSRYNAGKSISFHRIPAIHIEPKRHQEWLDRIRRDPGPYFKISTCTRVCSKHFLPSDFVRTLTGKRNLKPECVPSVFQWSEDSPTQLPPANKKCLGASKNTLKPVQPSLQIEMQGVQSTESLHNGSFLDHCYDTPPTSESEMLGAAREEIARLQEHTSTLEGKLFFLERFSNDSNLLYFYTGFKDYTVLKSFFASLKPSSINTAVWTQCQLDADVIAKDYGPVEHTLSLIDQFFMFLCRVRQGFCEQDLAIRFNVSQSTVIKIIMTWANYLYIYVKDMLSWPSREIINQTMPGIFQATYPQARVILSCVELKVQTSSLSTLASGLFTVRNKYSIFKGLLGLSPCGNVIFKSSLYDGTTSKKEITRLSGILDLLEPKDVIIAATDFSIGDLLDSLDVQWLEYPFESSDSASTHGIETMGEEVIESEDVDILEVTVEGEQTAMKEQLVPSGEEPTLSEQQQRTPVDRLPYCIGELSATVGEEVPGIVGNGCLAAGGETLCDEEVQIEGVLRVPDSDGEEAPFAIREEELTAQELEDVCTLSETEKMGCLTTHVEEVVERIKEFRLFDTVIPIHLASTLNQLWVVCAVLCTFRRSQI